MIACEKYVVSIRFKGFLILLKFEQYGKLNIICHDRIISTGNNHHPENPTPTQNAIHAGFISDAEKIFETRSMQKLGQKFHGIIEWSVLFCEKADAKVTALDCNMYTYVHGENHPNLDGRPSAFLRV